MNQSKAIARGLCAALPLLALASVGCGERDVSTLAPAPFDSTPFVFTDESSFASVDYQAFSNSKFDALQIDTEDVYEGTSSLIITVPELGNPTEWFAGGAFVALSPRDLSRYNALTFWAKASIVSNLDIVGFGNDNTGESLYDAGAGGLPLTTEWTRYVVPIPNSARLGRERGLFFFAEGAEAGSPEGHTLWFDDIRYEYVQDISDPEPVLSDFPITATGFTGTTLSLGDSYTTFDAEGSDIRVDHSAAYFDFESSDETVAIGGEGTIEIVGGGTATITAFLRGVEASGSIQVKATAPPSEPAPTPTLPGSQVISVFSNAYSNIQVDTWKDFGTGQESDFVVDGDDVKLFTGLGFIGASFWRNNNQIDASGMTHFHVDIWATDPGSGVQVKLVDFGADGAFGGGDDKEGQFLLRSVSTPPFETGKWISLDIPLRGPAPSFEASFPGLTTTEHISQLIFASIGSGNNATPTIFVDNIYFHN